MASRDELIQRNYGLTQHLFDRTYFALETEAFHFVNDLLRRTAPADMYRLDESWAKVEASQFWQDLASGVETYEFGARLYFLAMQTDSVSFPIGPGMLLRRIGAQWAAERFDRSDEIPSNQWALAITRQRKRTGSLDTSPRDSDEDIESALTQRALLALRLVWPRNTLSTFTGSRYRVGVSGYRKPNELAFFSEASKDWADIATDFMPPNHEVDELTRIAAVLHRCTGSQENILEQDTGEVLDLALRCFNSAYIRRQWRDKVVDLVETMEALLGDNTEGLAYKVGMRIALLLGTDKQHSVRIFTTVKHLYGLRSGIVHGDPESTDPNKSGPARKTIIAWRGGAGVPSDTKKIGPATAMVGSELVAAALRSFLRLSETPKNPFSNVKAGSLKRFLRDELDPLAFCEEERRQFQNSFGIVPSRITTNRPTEEFLVSCFEE